MEVYSIDSSMGIERIIAILEEKRVKLEDYIARVEPIVRDVSRRCYDAVREYSEKLDGISFDDPRIGRESLASVMEDLDGGFVEAVERIAKAVKEYSRALIPPPLKLEKVVVEWKPLERVAVYVPGGRSPYPSTAIMGVALASAAGVRDIVVITPPCRGCKHKTDAGVIAASFIAGASSVYAVGGPHGIAGVAYGCKPLPRVQKIVGPGGPYVQAAKILVSHLVGIDMVAGPTELFIIVDSSADPKIIALEALAQAEHGANSIVVIASPDKSLLHAVRGLLERLGSSGMAPVFLVATGSLEEALAIAEAFAPEHLLIEARDPEKLAESVTNAGIVSLAIPTAYIDYAAGPSHILPTGGAASWRGGLTVLDFMKPVQLVRGVVPHYLELAKLMAIYEGFAYHLKSLEVRRPG